MNTRTHTKSGLARWLLMLAATVPFVASAQVPVDDNGNAVGTWQPSPAAVEQVVGDEDIPLLSGTELEDLVGPIALYPDDLLAIVLPAAAYPLQVVDAARFLEELEADPSLKPDPEWDDSIVALLNYPEILEHLNEDIDWTWRLGEAVVAQQTDVVSAIERFRDRAYAAGNLKSDPYQNVTRSDGVIEITPVSEDVIYVPYYEPERVVVYQPRPVYYYYPRAYPVYYYPYSSAYDFNRGYFWGVTTAFTVGWLTDSLHVYHHSYHGHPYYGRTYWDRWWYRRPSITVYNTTYVRSPSVTVNRYYQGDRWHPRHDRREYVRNVGDVRVTRNWNYQPERNVMRTESRSRTEPRELRRQEPITFRDRSSERREPVTQQRSARSESIARQFRERNETVSRQSRERSESVSRQSRERSESIARQFRERNESVSTQSRERREPVSAQTRQRTEPAARRAQPQHPPTTTQRQVRREPATIQRPATREPVRQARPERRQPSTPTRVTRRESQPAPQARSSSRAAPKPAQSKRSESRARSESRDERRTRN